MRTNNYKISCKFPRKSSGMNLKRVLPVIVEESKQEEEEEDNNLAERLDMLEVDVFSSLVNDVDNVKSRRSLEKFVKTNKKSINGLSSSAKHKFLNLLKDKFY